MKLKSFFFLLAFLLSVVWVVLLYIATEENMPDDNPPIGIILSKEKDELLVEYATYGMDSNLFVSKYELYLPNRDELKRLVDRIIEEDIQQG